MDGNGKTFRQNLCLVLGSDGMQHIIEFCKDAKSIMISTERIESLKDNNINIDYTKNEIYRDIENKDRSQIFMYEFNLRVDLTTEAYFMKTIEMFYPNIFTWRYNGEHIECLALMPMIDKYLGIYTRYKTMINFIFRLRKQLLTVIKYRNDRDFVFDIKVDDYIKATGSLNKRTNMYVVPISPNYSGDEILIASRDRVINTTDIKSLNMRYWAREINPDFFKEPQLDFYDRKIPITDKVFDYYPPCIKKLAGMKKKGNYGRFLLASFLLSVHGERDAKHQLDLMLTDDERIHMNDGNCKDQWRAILTKKYSPPSCKTMIEQGYCTDCKHASLVSYTFKKFRESEAK